MTLKVCRRNRNHKMSIDATRNMFIVMQAAAKLLVIENICYLYAETQLNIYYIFIEKL